MTYINKGHCIFCLRDKSQTKFTEKPHTMPKSLGSVSIGVDICNECNHYFGEPDLLTKPHLCIEVCVKEIFGLIKQLIITEKEERKQERLKSIYFEYWKSKQKIVIKSTFRHDAVFLKTFTNQFKRGIYEMFLQEYHKETGNGLDSCFNEIREYARYNKGNIPLYYVQNSRGILFIDNNISSPKFHFSPAQFEDIDNYGFYTLIILGQWFYLEVTPRAKLCRDIYLRNEVKKVLGTGFVFNSIIEISTITDIDFTLRNLYGGKK